MMELLGRKEWKRMAYETNKPLEQGGNKIVIPGVRSIKKPWGKEERALSYGQFNTRVLGGCGRVVWEGS